MGVAGMPVIVPMRMAGAMVVPVVVMMVMVGQARLQGSQLAGNLYAPLTDRATLTKSGAIRLDSNGESERR